MWDFGRKLGWKYQRFITATAVSSIGDGLLITALPIIARASTSRPLYVTAVFAAGRLPWAAGLLFGSMADRRDARFVLVASDFARAAVLALFGVYLFVHKGPVPIWTLGLISAALSIGAITFFAASQRVLPSLVETQNLEAANGNLSSVQTAGEMFVGPQLGAWLAVTGPSRNVVSAGTAAVVRRSTGVVPIVGDAVSFALSGIALAKLDPIPPERTEASLREDIRTGWNWFRSSPLVMTLTATITWLTFLTAAALSSEIILVKDTLGLSEKIWFGPFTAVLAVGSIVGSSLAPRIGKIFGASTFPVTAVVMGVCYLACVRSRSPLVVFSALFVQQAATMAGLVASLVIRQRAIPATLRGRVISLSRSFTFGSQFFGALLGGKLIEAWGTDGMFFVTGSLIVIGAAASAKRLRNLVQATLVN
jgi:MFS family permease